MSQLVDRIAVMVEAFVAAIGYPGIFIVSLFENIFPPLPTEPLLPFVGMMVVEGRMTYVIAWFAAVSGSVSGSFLVYCLGMYADDPIVRAFIRRYGRYLGINEAELDGAIALFNRYGAPAVFFGRSIPVIKSVVSLAAGVSRMPLHKFLFFSALNSFLSVGVWLYMGTLVGYHWDALLTLADTLMPVLIAGGLVVLVVGYILLRRRQTASKPAVIQRRVRIRWLMNSQLPPDSTA